MKKLSFLKKTALLSMVLALSFFVFGCTVKPKTTQTQPDADQAQQQTGGRLQASPEGEAQTVQTVNTNVKMENQTDVDKTLDDLDKMPSINDEDEIDDSDIDQF